MLQVYLWLEKKKKNLKNIKPQAKTDYIWNNAGGSRGWLSELQEVKDGNKLTVGHNQVPLL